MVTRAKGKRMSPEKQAWFRREFASRPLYERVFGAPGLTVPMGRPEGLDDETLERVARRYRRGLEDVRDGLAKRAQPDLTVEETEELLACIEREKERRATLAYSYGAREDGTEEEAEFLDAGGLEAVVEAERAGTVLMVVPNYRLATWIDLNRYLQDRLCALLWDATSWADVKQKTAKTKGEG